MAEHLSSLQNPRIKNIVRLQEKSQERRAQGLMVIEGEKEVRMAAAGGFRMQALYLCPELRQGREGLPAVPEVFTVSRDVFAKIAYREDRDGVLALAEPRPATLQDLVLPADPLLLILESVEKPGNLGAILRTADGAGIHAVIVCDPRTDLWNPNAIRSSVGCIFSVPAAICTTAECQAFLRARGIRSYAATPQGADLYTAADYRGPAALVLGTEHEGLSPAWIEGADARIFLPMRGQNDSLNVSVAAGILAYEALRQRMPD